MFFWSIALFVPQVFFILYASMGIIGVSALVFLSSWFALVLQYKLVPAPFRWSPPKTASEDSHELASIV